MLNPSEKSLKRIAAAPHMAVSSRRAARLSALLDAALAETFPASDPVAVNVTRICAKTFLQESD